MDLIEQICLKIRILIPLAFVIYQEPDSGPPNAGVPVPPRQPPPPGLRRALNAQAQVRGTRQVQVPRRDAQQQPQPGKWVPGK